MTQLTLTPFDESIPAWEKAIYALLAEKERRSGSKRTFAAYTTTLQRYAVGEGSARQYALCGTSGDVPGPG